VKIIVAIFVDLSHSSCDQVELGRQEHKEDRSAVGAMVQLRTDSAVGNFEARTTVAEEEAAMTPGSKAAAELEASDVVHLAVGLA
jgi:hypothetical protein